MLSALAVAVGLVAGGSSAWAGPLEDRRREAVRLTTELESQARVIVDLSRRSQRAAETLAGVSGEVDKAQTEMVAAEERHQLARRRLAADAQLAYIEGRPTRMFSLREPAGSPEALSRGAYLRIVASRGTAALEDLRSVREELARHRLRLSEARERARGQVQVARKEEDAARQAVTAQRSLLRRVNGEVAEMVRQEQARRDAAAVARQRAPSAPAARSQAPSRSRLVPSGPDSAPGVIDEVFGCIRQLESGNRYGIGNGGAYQFLDSTWRSLGYSGSAQEASPAVQDEAARRLQARSGWGQWTTARLCGRP
ncbi:MAG: transglycosylase family protein [Acidimicrobiales bacterium]